jgi:hypothetical protein
MPSTTAAPTAANTPAAALPLPALTRAAAIAPVSIMPSMPMLTIPPRSATSSPIAAISSGVAKRMAAMTISPSSERPMAG